MIIVEGPDGAGKTSLVRRLMAEVPELRIGERGTKDRKLLYTVTVPDTFRALEHAVRGKGWHTDHNVNPDSVYIWDRLFYSEMVYAPLGMPPREPMFNAAQQQHIHRIIEALWCPVILCLPPLTDVKRNVLVEEQMPGVIDHVVDIYDSYVSMWENGEFPRQAVLYDYTTQQDGYDKIVSGIRAYIETRRERAW